MQKRHWLALAAFACAALPGTGFTQGNYPVRPIKIIVPFTAGTAADIVARQLAPGMSEILGQGVVIENVAGAGGSVGAAQVAKAAPDGYTLLMFGVNNAINPALYKDLSFDTQRDLKPIARVAIAPLAIVANPKFPSQSIRDLLTAAKAAPRGIFYGSGGNGSVTHLALELLNARGGIQLTHVPYKGIAQMMTDVMGNQIPLAAPALATALGPAKAGNLKILGVTSLTRSPLLPDVPTVAEQGLPGFDVTAWNGLMAPAGTPDDIVAKLQNAALRVAGTREFGEQMNKQAMKADPMNAAEFRRFVGEELSKWDALVKSSGAKVD